MGFYVGLPPPPPKKNGGFGYLLLLLNLRRLYAPNISSPVVNSCKTDKHTLILIIQVVTGESASPHKSYHITPLKHLFLH